MPVIAEGEWDQEVRFPGFWFQQTFAVLKIMENPKGLLFLWVISIKVYFIRN